MIKRGITEALARIFVDEAFSNSVRNHIPNIGKVGKKLSIIRAIGNYCGAKQNTISVVQHPWKGG